MPDPKTAIQLLEDQNELLREQNGIMRKLLACQEKLLDRVLRGPSGNGARPASTAGNGASSAGKVASDRDMDGQHGNPSIRNPPKDWGGADYTGYRFSETTPEFLDFLAKDLDGLAAWIRRQGDEKKAGYKELDAARARGWARRLRAGWQPTAAPSTDDDGPAL